MQYDVKAQAFSRATGAPHCDPRIERVTCDAKNIMDVKKYYETFWNELNPNSDSVVFVQEITPVPARR